MDVDEGVFQRAPSAIVRKEIGSAGETPNRMAKSPSLFTRFLRAGFNDHERSLRASSLPIQKKRTDQQRAMTRVQNKDNGGNGLLWCDRLDCIR